MSKDLDRSTSWPKVPLKELLLPVRRQEVVEPLKAYELLGAHWYAKGLYIKDTKAGTQIRAKRLYRVEEGDFVYNRLFAWKGSFAVATAANAGCYVSNEFPCFQVEPARLDQQYLRYYFGREDAWNDALGLSYGATPTSRNRLKAADLLSLHIPLPPLDEQHRIVARIEVLTTKVDAARKLREEARAGQQALLRSVFQKIVACAEHRPMAEVASIVRRWVEVDPVREYHELGIRSFGKGTFHKPAITGLELGSKRILRIEPDDLVLMNVFAWEGAIAVVRPEDRGRVGSHRYITCVPEPGVVTALFLCFYLLTPEGLSRIRHASPGGAGRNRTLGLRKLEKIEVPVPDYSSQIRFGELQSRARSMEMLQEQSDDKLARLIPAILDKAFKGEL